MLQRVLSLKLTGLMCDGRLLASPLFSPPGGPRRLLFPVSMCFCAWWLFLDSRFYVDHHSASRGFSLGDCGRPCDPLSCLLFSALWLRCSPSLLMQKITSSKDADLTCSKTLFRDATCLPLGPMSLGWPVNPFGRSAPVVPSGDQRQGTLSASERSRWRQDALQAQPQILQRTTWWDGCGHLPFRRLAMYYLERPGPYWICFPNKRTESPNSIISKNSLDHNIICLQEVHGKNEFLPAIQVLAPRFRLFGTIHLDSEYAGGSAICIHRDLLLEDAVVTHVVTCQGRDHLVNSQSGRHNLVIVNVPFEPELTLRQLRGRWGIIHPH